MDIAEPERSGRHRLEHGSGDLWLPLGPVPDPSPHAGQVVRPGALPVQRTRDPVADTDAVGLRKFNIGLVPASVTPPRTWKRAAWFAVVSSAAVLVGLAYAAAKLVGADSPEERIGMPGYPTASPLITGFDTPAPPVPTEVVAVRPERPDRPDQPREERAAAVRGTDEVRPRTTADPAPPGAATGEPSTAGRPGAGPGRSTAEPADPSTAPTVTTVPGRAKPLVDAAAIVLRTERFYEQAVADAEAAMAMVSDGFRSDAEALLEQRFSDVSAIEVTAITVDPASGATVSTLRVTKSDGSTTTERRELLFTTAGDPLINAERLLDAS
ncbi:hypothetical protein AB0I60_18185 [Actinosynnema sp. NPDC050436]|uniref:hypothetical protein n=1 Tax=Actinosynnema sp. NPDC050436 TaxID=3155659 RepID=UPI0033C1DD05